jgi:hypothetical protein
VHASLQAQAAEAAVREASAAVAGGARVAAFRLDVGLDTKALTEAWAACQKAHPQLPVMFLSADASACSDFTVKDLTHYFHLARAPCRLLAEQTQLNVQLQSSPPHNYWSVLSGNSQCWSPIDVTL